jgi:transcriptional regulator with XRE-family HTH domain
VSPRTAARPDEYTTAVAAALQAERAAAGLTIAQLADRSGLVPGTLWRVLHSQRAMTVAQLAALAPVFGMRPSQLLAAAERRSTRAPIRGAVKRTPTKRKAGP